MPKEEIVEGLKAALSKGESLEKAMMSFYNAGYSKEDIEEAASALQFLLSPHIPSTQFASPAQQAPPIPSTQFASPAQQAPPSDPKQIYYQPGQAKQLKQPSRIIQRVSEYGERPSKTGTVITIVLVFLLVILLGVLAAVFLFKDELSNFFNKVLGL